MTALSLCVFFSLLLMFILQNVHCLLSFFLFKVTLALFDCLCVAVVTDQACEVDSAAESCQRISKKAAL